MVCLHEKFCFYDSHKSIFARLISHKKFEAEYVFGIFQAYFSVFNTVLAREHVIAY